MNIETAKKVKSLLEQKEDLEIIRDNLFLRQKSILGFYKQQDYKFDGIVQNYTENRHFLVASYINFKNNDYIREKLLKFVNIEIQEIDNQIKQIEC